MSDKKVFWIGNNTDEKSANIGRKLYIRGQEIPADKVEKKRLDRWIEKGLVSVGKNPPVIIKDTETVKNLEAEIRSLKADLDSLPGLKNKVEELETALKKAKTGKKSEAFKALEVDNQEKAALIEKLNKEIDDLTAPGNKSADADKTELGSDESAPGVVLQ